MKILIVGSGISGLTIRRCCETLGVNFRIIEKKPGPVYGYGGLGLPGNAVSALNRIGLYPSIQNAFPIHKIEYRSFDDITLTEKAINATTVGPSFSPFFGMSRGSLHTMLLQSGSTKVEYGTTVSHLKEEEEKVEATFSDGSVDHFDFVIGADGIHSAMRKRCHQDSALASLPVMNWRFLAKKPSDLTHPVYMFGETDLWMLYPVNAEQIYCYAQTPINARSFSLTPQENLKDFLKCAQQFKGFTSKVLEEPLLIEKLYSQPLNFSSDYYPGKERILLVGDAAHAFTPILQQGAAQAIEDGIILSFLLDSVNRKKLDPRNLSHTFVSLRKTRVKYVIDQSSAIARSVSNPPMSSKTQSQNLENILTRIFAAWQNLFVEDPFLKLQSYGNFEKFFPINPISEDNLLYYSLHQRRNHLKEGVSNMITLKIEYFLNSEGLKYFESWYEELEKVISKQEGFESISSKTEGNPIIYLQFSSENTLEAWSEKEIHDELFSKIEKYFLKPVGVENIKDYVPPGKKLCP